MKSPARMLRNLLVTSLLLMTTGCAGNSTYQSLQYSSKNSKNDTWSRLPLRVSGSQLTEMLENITELVGTGYRYGGNGDGAFDCSGFVQHIFSSSFNVSIPRTAREQSRFGQRIDRHGLQRGDLVFFRLGSGRIDHVGIYLHNDLFIHASSSKGVTLGNLMKPYYHKRFAHATRLIEVR
ncbi:C40 family peptidase [Prosthecochloris sp. HL-130-GSB]|jgi:cell wall-associated NlpC family hydrolase|uniref:NlpC/P60 family protein n=1 Tax=Prosthecochloris aestuarii TaxID=1102 RepID=A0A831SPC7_PROAE|nr:NlpC/P60 family protein [Prosthecochloris sp. HL-130-GSB]ARM31680.1 hypothetical protein B9H02_10700 [Prosthecochloris sp. HL-130-GSB]MBO8093074.1 C40 family peptidase [Prosthecochloris sp.]HED30464.1 NlpC/P60 family protein [Prosthecochloris aestuarii]